MKPDTPLTATDKKTKKVIMVSHSDLLGGAAVVTYRLMQAMRRNGIDARMLVYTKVSSDTHVMQIGTRWRRGLKFITERVNILFNNGFSKTNLFKVSTADIGFFIHNHPWIKQADIIMLGWINQGLMSLESVKKLAKLNKPIVWTMHDMWNLTGICHHAYECKAYVESCGHCQFLTGKKEHDLSRTVWKRKKKLYESIPIKFVAVSNWLAEKCSESSLLKNADITVIPNAFPIDSFSPSTKSGVLPLGMNSSQKLIVMGAARLDDPIKGLNYTIEALNYIFDNYPKVAAECCAVFFGDVRNSAAFDNLRFSHILTGRINDPDMLRCLYANSRVVLSTSLYETLPGTLIEGQASGCLPVTFGNGGQSDIVEHKVTGYIADYKNSQSVAEGILWALDQDIDRNFLHQNVKDKFSSNSVVKKYVNLFNSFNQ